ncbi:Ankyrin repeat domain-containing protein 50 [Cladobotryum mycophilum]|uniref:Ankyrin repeat domain-containing protein 50 n=1 Tax=Cladobotryum mycophilum TaxID=491253 RepID=A0ABR0T480_9HYPO
MHLFDFPDELLEAIGKNLSEDGDIAALVRTSHRFYNIFCDYLYLHNEKNEDAMALTWAAMQGREETLLRASEAGVDVSAHPYLFSLAVSDGHAGFVKTLLSIGGIDATIMGDDGWTPLGLAINKGNTEIVKLLLDHNVDIVRPMIGGWTPINVAASRGHFDIFKLLLDRKADINIRSLSGWSPLTSASAGGYVEIVKLLLDKGADIAVKSNLGWTCLHSAANAGHAKVVEVLLDHGADTTVAANDGWTPLTLAADKNRHETVQLLAERGVDVELPCGSGWTALMLAADHGQADMMKALLDHGASTTCRTDGGWTPLILASNNGHLRAAELLLEHGADADTATNIKWTALMAASDNGYFDIVKLLLEKGADMEATNDNGWTALFAATDSDHTNIVKYLLDHGADYACRNKGGQTPAIRAAHVGSLGSVELFLTKPNFDVDQMDNQGRSLLFHAAMRGHVEILQTLLPHGKTMNTQDRYGTTPIVAATRNGHGKVVELLLRRDCADMEETDMLGSTLYETARRGGNETLIKMLRKHAEQTGVRTEEEDSTTTEGGEYKFEAESCWCDVCCRSTVHGTESYVCDICDGGGYVICSECSDAGLRCQDEGHEWRLHRCSRTGGVGGGGGA